MIDNLNIFSYLAGEESENENTFRCKICENDFKDKKELQNHINTHQEEGDWACSQCQFQTNNRESFTKHIKITHIQEIVENKKAETQSLFKCALCAERFKTKVEANRHRIKNHKTYKPCNNFPQGNCTYGDNCFFNHIILQNGYSICYECGKTFSERSLFMSHRKNAHEPVICKEFEKGLCKFTNQSCWWTHNKEIKSPNGKMIR